ncbi:hypothetical protein TrVE_jg2181 [Triparma verrucosa]|uniref:Ankyrin repeat protein n=1 Tax=Triparma verrucosa TaxID=1606542 RepID=A0A9W7FLN2_9STRA|nr:hypothetical protein TrVE_jg2181 [Triparma verrucosa]
MILKVILPFLICISIVTASCPEGPWTESIIVAIRESKLTAESPLIFGENAKYLDEECLGHDGSMTPIMLAAKVGSKPSVIKALISAGASISHKHRSGTTAIMFAAREGEREALKALLEHAQKLGTVDSELTSVDEHGNTPLHLSALQSSCPSCASIMFLSTPSRSFSVLSNANGNTPLQIASFYAVSSHFVDLLLSEKTVKDAIDQPASTNGRTALMLAVSANADHNVISLIKNGADPNFSSGGVTAIELAKEKGMDHLIPIMSKSVSEL